MKPEDQEKLTRWIDGELEPAALEDLLARHPELRAEKKAAKEIGDSLRSEMESGERIPFPDFFNHQIQRAIEQERHPALRASAYEGMPSESFFSLFKLTRNLAAAALLVLLGVFIGSAIIDRGPDGTEIVTAYTPDPSVVAEVHYSADADATILLLEGLAAIPDDHDITKHHTASYRPGRGGLVTTLYSTNPGAPALVLVKGPGGSPTIYEVSGTPGTTAATATF
ncbi:MAG: anti-sigma factor [Verrucomicrobiales bacterium]